MSKLTFIHNKPLIEDIFDYDLIIVGTGIHNALGNGFQYDVKINFPQVEKIVKQTPYADVRKLGSVTVVNENPIFCVGFIHKGGYRKDLNPDYLDYKALEDVLNLIDSNFENKKIATTLLGCSQYDGNGNKEKVLEIFNKLSNNDFFIYDYEQRDYREINNEKWAEITSLVGKIPYQELRKLKDEYIKIRKFGIHGAKKINL
jgi:hypothetical protein